MNRPKMDDNQAKDLLIKPNVIRYIELLVSMARHVLWEYPQVKRADLNSSCYIFTIMSTFFTAFFFPADQRCF